MVSVDFNSGLAIGVFVTAYISQMSLNLELVIKLLIRTLVLDLQYWAF